MGHYDGMEFKTFGEIYRIIEEHKEKIRCIGCFEPLSQVGYHYAFEVHSGGVFIREFGENVWVWVECHNCGYQNALWKLLKQLRG